MATTWQYSVHSHPWFRMPSHKRKTIEHDNSSSSDASDYDPSPIPKKRLRCGILENGFAQLSLASDADAPQMTELAPAQSFAALVSAPQIIPVPEPPPREGTWDEMSYDDIQADPPHPQPVILPGSVEEPISPETRPDQASPDVTMRSRSWYEPEKDRIVVVDLDDSDVEEETETTPQLAVNTALLNRIKGHTDSPLPGFAEPASNMALVLFRPLPKPEDAKDTWQQMRTEPRDSATSQAASSGRLDGHTDINIIDTAHVDFLPMDVDSAMEIE
ncbi:hypothetical protein BDW22DRAFT_1358188 [Trametopsis cervina]|nr:hypothetical protein BDW22DRAFT_1358188 [Trametopsis cervina]